jgi:NAD(P)-dependent dehydrogenase (short-subunit alcohol dehydrogenase family)
VARHVLIVGGTKGAGRATVQRFSADGWFVSVIGRSASADSGSAAKDVAYYGWDIAERARAEVVLPKVVAHRGNPSCIVFFQRFRGEGDSLLGEIDVGVGGTARIIDFLVEKSDLRNCAIVVVGSVNADFIGERVSLGYHIAKAALRQLVRYYAVRLGPRGIRVNGVSPGTFLKNESREYFESQPRLIDLYRRITPLRRMGDETEVAHVVAFLGTDPSSFVTGQEITVDGGLTSGSA